MMNLSGDAKSHPKTMMALYRLNAWFIWFESEGNVPIQI
jgi:hypothetical protein